MMSHGSILILLGSVAAPHSYSGEENGSIFMNCSGTEESVFDCELDYQHHCDHTEVASVICAGQLPPEIVK